MYLLIYTFHSAAKRLFSDNFALAISVFAFAFSYFARYKDD